ncbi:MAG: copper transporter, partial [Mycobacterium sp.]|nr:copper transporter [Mycobacterium sp.]
MKSRRRRVITLAAVIVALAVGFVLGARLNSGPMLSVLRNDKGDLQQRVDALVQENRALGERLSAADDFDAAMSERMVRGALADKSVVIFRAPDAQGADVDGVVRLIGQAGGSVTGTVELTSEFINGNSGEKLRSVVNSPIVPPGTQLNTDLVDEGAQAGDLLGIALLINRDAAAEPVDDAARDTVLASLRDTGFLTYGELPGAANAAVVVTGGALAQDAGNQGATVARFAAGLAPHGAGTVLAGRAGSAAGVSAVALVRAEPNMSALVSTVDDVDAESGQITTVLALQSMIGGGPPGQYGVGAG